MVVLIGILGGIALFAILVLYTALSWSLVMYKFWYWFILPVFTSLPTVSYIQCLGIVLFVNAVWHSKSEHVKSEYVDKNSKWGSYSLGPWIVLFIGWLFKIIFM